MKFISWNVNGLRACDGKGFREAFATLNADFFCLQETKMQPHQLDIAFDGYQSFWNSAEKKGYSGTAIFTKHQPLNVTYGLGIEEPRPRGARHYTRNASVLSCYGVYAQLTRWTATT